MGRWLGKKESGEWVQVKRKRSMYMRNEKDSLEVDAARCPEPSKHRGGAGITCIALGIILERVFVSIKTNLHLILSSFTF